MKRTCLLALALCGILGTGCYRADITTGLAPSGEVVEDEWVLGFVNGLAIVDDVDAEECTNGIARVMTRQSFLNVVINVLTGGIVSPMEVRVECAAAPAGAAAGTIEAGDTPEELGAALQRAALESARTGAAVYVSFGE